MAATSECSRVVRRAVVLLLVAITLGSVAASFGADSKIALSGACYCKVQDELTCLGETTHADCDRRCAESLCDDWFWLERRPCWTWGYGG